MVTRRNTAWIIAGSVAVAAPLVLLLKRSDEKVSEFGLTQRNLGIAHGEAFSESGDEILARSVDGSRTRRLRVPLVKGSSPRQLVRLPGGRTLLQCEEAGAAPGLLGGSVNSTPDVRQQRSRLWDISVGLSEPVELLPQLPKSRLRVAGDHGFWLKPARERLVTEWLGKRRIERTVIDCALIASPLDGGPSMRVALGLSSFEQPEPVGDGISWHGNPENGESFGTRLVAFPPEFRVVQVNASPTVGAPIHAAGDRLMWVESQPAAEGSLMATGTSVVSCNRDGTDRRLVASIASSSEWLPTVTVVGALDRALICAIKKKRFASGEYQGASTFVARIDEGGIAALKRLPDEVSSCSLNDGFLYYTVMTRSENWFDWSPKGLAPRMRWVTYRTPLPTRR